MPAAVTTAVFWLVQGSAITVLFVPFSWSLVGLWAVSHFLRAIGLTLAFHLRFLDTCHWVPPLSLAVAMFAIGGWPWLAWGFCLPTVTLAHATFAINTVNHLWGTRRFETRDDSTNNVVTAFFAAGEGWHNNHHRYQRAARNGFSWWEIDVTYHVIRAMAAVGLAWNLQPVPARIYAETAGGRAMAPTDTNGLEPGRVPEA